MKKYFRVFGVILATVIVLTIAAGLTLKILGVILAAVIVLPIAAGLTLKGLARDVPPPGRLIDVGGHKLHLNRQGPKNELPTIIIEAGTSMASPAYHYLQAALAEITDVCTYDRAGLGWSQPAPQLNTSDRIADDLHTLVDKAGVQRPFVFVGHSVAGLHMRVYQEKYPRDVQAIVFLDAALPHMFEAMAFDVTTFLASLKLQVRVIKTLSNLGLTYLWNPLYRRLGFPAEIERQIKVLLKRPSASDGMLAEFVSGLESHKQTSHLGTLGALPTLVVTAADTMSGALPSTLEPTETNTAWLALQAELMALSSNSCHVTIKNADHNSLVTDQANVHAVADHIGAWIAEKNLKRDVVI